MSNWVIYIFLSISFCLFGSDKWPLSVKKTSCSPIDCYRLAVVHQAPTSDNGWGWKHLSLPWNLKYKKNQIKYCKICYQVIPLKCSCQLSLIHFFLLLQNFLQCFSPLIKQPILPQQCRPQDGCQLKRFS